MNARKFLNVRVGLTVTALALSGAMVLAASCAGSGSSGGSSGNNGEGGSSSGGSSGGSAGSSTTPTGGSSTCSAGADSVCFAAGQASGAMTGYGWIAMGPKDSASSPKCAPDAADTTKTQAISAPNTDPGPCPSKGQTMWDTTDSLCISGSIPALPGPSLDTQADYDNNWGVQVGVNASTTEGTEIGTAYSSVAISFNGKPTTGLRAELHIKGDPAGTTYCYNGMTSGTDMKMTDFITTCWDGASCTSAGCKALTADAAKNIDKIGVQVSSVDSVAITVDKLCLTGIQFKK